MNTTPSATPDTPSTDSINSLVTGLYWRKNLWNGAATVPAILSFENDAVTMSDKKAQIFNVPLSSIQARITLLGTLILTVEGKHYDFVGTGSGISSQFSAEQQATLMSATSNNSTNAVKAGTIGAAGGGVVGAIAGEAAGAATSVAGAGLMAAGYFVGLGAIKKWQELLVQKGIIDAKDRSKIGRNAAIFFVVLVVVVFGVTAILSTLFDKS